MAVDPLTGVRYSANQLLQRRSLSAYAVRELLDAADAIDAWLAGDGADDDEDRRVDRFRGAFEALRAVESHLT